jgi:DNA adenine methylase
LILNRNALDVIRREDRPDTLFYLDPPYLGETRTADVVYSHEMDNGAHPESLDVITNCAGRVMISGYRSDLYDR